MAAKDNKNSGAFLALQAFIKRAWVRAKQISKVTYLCLFILWIGAIVYTTGYKIGQKDVCPTVYVDREIEAWARDSKVTYEQALKHARKIAIECLHRKDKPITSMGVVFQTRSKAYKLVCEDNGLEDDCKLEGQPRQ